MIAPAKRTSTFKCPEVGQVLDDAYRRCISFGVEADRTWLDCIEITANRAGADRVCRFCQCCCQRFEEGLSPFDQMQRGPPRRAGSEARQLGEKLDKCVEFGHGRRDAVARSADFREVARRVRTAISYRREVGGPRSACASPVRRAPTPCLARRERRRRSGLPKPRPLRDRAGSYRS